MTHILPDDGAKTAQPQDTSAGDFVDKHALAAEHGLAEALTLVILDHALRRGQEGVFSHAPDFVAVETEEGDVAQGGWREEDLAWTGIVGDSHVTAGQELFHRELDSAFEADGVGHGDHDAYIIDLLAS